MKVWILGSGTLLPHPRRGSPGYWLEVVQDRILLDCGSGTLGRLARLGLEWSRISHILLTHFHTDHVGDLAPILFALKHGPRPPRTLPLSILGPRGLKDHLHALSQAHGSYVLEPGFPLLVEEIGPHSAWKSDSGDYSIQTFRTLHTETAQAYRLEGPGGTFGFSGDTGPVEGMAGFFREVDLMVAECSNPDGKEMENHLTPRELAVLARDAAPKLLVNVHAYPPLDPEAVPDLLSERGYMGEVRPGRDGMRISIDPAGIQVESPGFPE